MAAKEQKSKAAPAQAAAAVKKPAARRTTTTRKTKAPEITDAMIAERAYYLSLEDEGADHVDNWLRAESELRG